jgi:ketosteroid isomerase-like protein
VALSLAAVTCALAAGPADDEARIASVLADLEAATNERDIARLLRHATEDIVVISKNGETLAGRPALDAYLRKMIGAAPSLREMRSRVRQDAPPRIQGALALVEGRSDDLYVFTAGMRLAIVTTWSATLVRESGDWRIARLHFSFNLFDNPILDAARSAMWWAAALGMLAGVGCAAAGWGIVRLLGRRRRRGEATIP